MMVDQEALFVEGRRRAVKYNQLLSAQGQEKIVTNGIEQYVWYENHPCQQYFFSFSLSSPSKYTCTSHYYFDDW